MPVVWDNYTMGGVGGFPVVPPIEPPPPIAPPMLDMAFWLKMPIEGQVDETLIANWPDSSGHSKPGIGFGAVAPVYEPNIIDGFPAARFTASNVFTPMSIAVNAGIEGWTEATLYILVKRTQDPGPAGGAGTAMWQFSANVSTFVSYNYSDGNIYDSAFASVMMNTGNPTADLSTNFRLYCIKSKAGDWTSYIDTVQHFNISTNTFSGINQAWLGQSAGQVGFFGFEGDIAEVIGYKAWHGDAPRIEVEDYFAGRFPSLDFEVSVEAPLLVVDNSGDQVMVGGENVVLTPPIQVVDNTGGDVSGVTL